MGISERRIKEKEIVRAAILSTAWKLVQEEGWQSLSIRKIAEAIEYSVPVIYDHFENKEAILMEFVGEGFKQLTVKMKQAYKKENDPVNKLKSMAHAYWNFALKNTSYYQLMFGVGMACCDGKGEVENEYNYDYYITEAISEVIDNSAHPETNVCLKYHTYWSILHGLVSIKILGNSPASGELNKIVLEDAIDGFIKNLI